MEAGGGGAANHPPLFDTKKASLHNFLVGRGLLRALLLEVVEESRRFFVPRTKKPLQDGPKEKSVSLFAEIYGPEIKLDFN